MKKQGAKNGGYTSKLIGFCSGQISQSLEAIVIAQLTYYLTESVYMSAAIVGVLLMSARIFDGFTDAVAGFLVDRTHTRWGRARPYALLFIPMWVAMVLIYSVPNVNVKIQIVYVFIMYVIIEAIARTFILCANTVLLKRAVNEDAQVNFLTISCLFAYIFSLVASVAMPTLISIFGQTKNGWTIIALFFAIPCTILGLLQFFLVKEIPVSEGKEKNEEQVPFMIGLKALLKNKFVFIFGIASFAYNVSYAISNSSGTYYFTYVIGDVAKLTTVSLFAFAALILMAFLPKMQEKFGSAKLISAGLILMVVSNLAKYMFPQNLLMLGILSALSMAGTLPLLTFNNVISIECMKYSFWQTGIPIEGIIASVNGVATKIGSGLGAALVGILMSMSGYDGAVAIQTESAVGMIKFLYAGLPAICALIGWIAMHFYTLERKLPQIETELKKGKKENE